MYISFGGPLFLIAIGAILKYATNFDISGVDMDTIGLILMIAGGAALLLSIAVAVANSSNNNQGPGGPSNPPPPPR